MGTVVKFERVHNGWVATEYTSHGGNIFRVSVFTNVYEINNYMREIEQRGTQELTYDEPICHEQLT